MDLRVLLLALAVALTDCGISSVPTQPYVPVSLAHTSSQLEVVERIVEVAESRGWEVVAMDPVRGSVTAVSNRKSKGVEERVTWSFTVSESRVRVTRWEALRYPGEPWTTSEGVCLTYTYFEERTLLHEVLGLPPPSVVSPAR